MQKRIVIADDDPTMRAALREALSAAGYAPIPCSNGEEADQIIKGGDVDLVISDVRMPGMTGIDLLKRCGGIPFIIISGYATVPEAVEAMKMGAYDFVVKPFSYREIIDLIEAALRRVGVEETDQGDTDKEDTGGIVTTHPRMRSLLEFATQVAKSQASVLIQGESGTGKELLARFIHARSRRSARPFVAVNCAALPEGLLESELFGYERGAFTGAVVNKPGKFELAHTGTLLLDEVSEIPPALQAKLLRVLQEREVDRLGGKKPLPIDIRVISTTNRELRGMIRSGTFREDLFYRLNVVPLRLPPLREKIQDIEPIARTFFIRKGYKNAALCAPALDVLMAHSWRGNVRELFNVLERAAILAPGGVIGPGHLLLEEDMTPSELDTPNSKPETRNSKPETEGHIRAGLSVREMEERLIYKTLTEVNDNRTQAANLLGISVRTLRNKLKQYQKSVLSNQLSGVSPDITGEKVMSHGER